MKDNHDELIASIIYLFKIPLTYINLLAISVSFSDIEAGMKILVYTTGIVASIYSIWKTRRELKKMDREEDI
jgi:hypothetical protein